MWTDLNLEIRQPVVQPKISMIFTCCRCETRQMRVSERRIEATTNLKRNGSVWSVWRHGLEKMALRVAGRIESRKCGFETTWCGGEIRGPSALSLLVAVEGNELAWTTAPHSARPVTDALQFSAELHASCIRKGHRHCAVQGVTKGEEEDISDRMCVYI